MRTKGNVIVEDIKVGDVQYEFEYNAGVKSVVVSAPECLDGVCRWQNRNLITGELIYYMVTEGFEHYGPNLYDYEAYKVKHWL